MSGGFCTADSAACGEPLAGTALEELRFVVCLEVPEAWPAKILAHDLGPRVGELLATLDGTPGIRVQFIRRPGDADETRRLIIADVLAGEAQQWLFTDIDSVVDLDWAPLCAACSGPSIASGVLPTSATRWPTAWPGGGQLLPEPLVLVCTHGRRDACCAKWGMALWRSLVAADQGGEVSLWQTSHLGGHRFAATALVLPQGYHYGRLGAEDGSGLLSAIVQERLYRLDRIRGRVCWSRPAQAADLFRRLEAMDTVPGSTASATLTESDEVTHATKGRPSVPPVVRHRVSLSLQGGQLRELSVLQRTQLGSRRPPSCGKEPEPVTSYALESAQASPGV